MFLCDISGSYGCHGGKFSLNVLLCHHSISGHFRIWQLKDISHFKSWQALESDVLGIRGSALIGASFPSTISPFWLFSTQITRSLIFSKTLFQQNHSLSEGKLCFGLCRRKHFYKLKSGRLYCCHVVCCDGSGSVPDRSIFGSHTIMAAASEALFTCRTAAGPTLRLIWMDSDYRYYRFQ